MTYHHHDGEDDDNVDDDFDGKDEWRHHSNDKKDDQEENYFDAEQTYTSNDRFQKCHSDCLKEFVYRTFGKTVVGVAKVVGLDDLPPTPYRCSNQIFQSAWAKLHLRDFLFSFSKPDVMWKENHEDLHQVKLLHAIHVLLILCTYWLSGKARRENIWLEVRTDGPSAARSMRPDRGPNIFQSGPT